MKRRLVPILVCTLALTCFFAGQPWLLFGEKTPMSMERRYASDRDLTFNETDQAPREKGEWTFTADKIIAEHDSQYVEVEGNATFTDGTETLRADFARYYRETGWLLLRGNVRAMWQGDFLEAAEAEFDLKKKEGWLKDGKVFMVKPHLYFESSYIRKYSGASYTFKDAKVTACSGEKPAWSVQAQEGDITLDGYATLWHTTFRIRDTPVAYLPYMKLPAGGGKRQSGFLMPEVGSSSRFGFRLNMPYYWAVSEEVDATFYQHFMSKRGYMQGLELRHADDSYTKGFWRFDWLNDAMTYRKDSNEDDPVEGDGLVRPNSNRWWWRSKFNGYLGTPSWRAMVDVDLVSDQDYLREFSDGYNGYRTSRDEMLDQFGRDINEADAETRTSTAMLTRDFQSFGVAGKIEYNQNPSYMNGNGKTGDNDSLQRMPELDAFAFKDSIGGTPLEFEGQAKYDYFQREKGTTGQRLELRPRLSLPLHTDAVTVIPYVGARSAFYSVDKWETDGNTTLANGQVEGNNTSEDENPMNLTVEAGVSLFSEVYKTYSLESDALALTKDNVGHERWTDVKHSLVPRIDYSYVPRKTGQSDLPYYDERDRVFGEDLVTYSLTNVFDRKREYVTLGPDGETPTLANDYLDFARVRVSQSYDRLEASRKDELDEYERRPFSDIMAEVSLQPFAGWELTSKSWYSPYLSQVTEHEHTLRYTREGVGDAFISYDLLQKVDEYKRRRASDMQVLHLGGNIYVMQNLILGMEYRTDLNEGVDLEKTLRLTWVGECYDVGLQFTRTDDDTRLGLHFNLFKF
ncbi:LPS-assembly protein LptD [Paucidesulfovibrio longus]|uniref:LPS-assembly protein LptD n=1 Tax=Paucidesulfovibrio longus TaxID=889 RepID=UPI0003B5E7B5|nr:LPS assembly protein LptD [Paucidesulfovibrio longus]